MTTTKGNGSQPRQHTGLTDLPLTAQGEAEAARLGGRLEGLQFAAVLTSPQRPDWQLFRDGCPGVTHDLSALLPLEVPR